MRTSIILLIIGSVGVLSACTGRRRNASSGETPVAQAFDWERVVKRYEARGEPKEAQRLMGHFYRTAAVDPAKGRLMGKRLFGLFVKRLPALPGGAAAHMAALSGLMGSGSGIAVQRYLERSISAMCEDSTKKKKGWHWDGAEYLHWALARYGVLPVDASYKVAQLTRELGELTRQGMRHNAINSATVALLRAIFALTDEKNTPNLRFSRVVMALLEPAFTWLTGRDTSDFARFSATLDFIREALPMVANARVRSPAVLAMLERCLFISNTRKWCQKALTDLDDPSLRGRPYDPRRLFALLAVGNHAEVPVPYVARAKSPEGAASQKKDDASTTAAPLKKPAAVPADLAVEECRAKWLTAASSAYFSALDGGKKGLETGAWVKKLVEESGVRACGLATAALGAQLTRFDDWSLIFIDALVAMGAKKELEQLYSHLFSVSRMQQHWRFVCDQKTLERKAECIKDARGECDKIRACVPPDGTLDSAKSLGDYERMLSRSAAVVKALLRLRSPLVSGEMLPRLIASTKTLGDPVYAMEVARAIPKGAMTSEGAAALHSLVTQGGKPFPWPIAYSLQFMGTRREAFYSGSSILFSQVHSHNLPNDLVVQDLACGEKKSLTEYRECAAKKLPGPYGWKVDPAIYCPCRRHMQLMNYLGYLPLGTSPWERIKKRATVTGRVIASCKSLLAAVKAPKHKKDPFRQCQPLSEFGRHTWQISESRRYKVMMQYGVPPLEATLRIGLTGSEQLRLKLLEQLWKKAPESYRKELKAISAAQLFDVLPRPVPTPEYAPYSLTPSEESERHKALLLPLEKHLADLARNQH